MSQRTNRNSSLHGAGVSAGLLLLVNSASAVAADPATPEVDTISVTATRVERETRDVPSAISVVDSQRIEGAKMMNIKDALQGIPGVLIDTKNGGYDVRLIIRGAGQKANYGVREIMVLRDGVPMTDPDSFSRFDYFDTQDIERIEITKGPGSLYGAGSAGGTVQIISKSVFDTDSNRIKLGLGNFGAQNYNFRFAGDIDDSNAASITASRRVLDNDWRRWNEFDTNQLSIKHGFMFGNGGTLESELSYSEANMQLPGTMSKAQFEEFRQTGEQTDNQNAWKHSGRYSNIWFFNSRLEQEWGKLVFRPRIYFNHWTHYHPVTGAINDNKGTDVFGADLEFTYDHRLLGASTLVAGVTARREDTDDTRKYEYRDVVTGFGGRILATLSDKRGDLMQTQSSTNSLYGIYAQESLRPGDRWLIDLSLRYDHSVFDIDTNEITAYSYRLGRYVPGQGRYLIDKTFDLYSPRIGVTYQLSRSFNLFGTIARSDQVPSENELRENPELDASTATNFEIGLKGRSGRWSLDTSVYHITVDDEIVPILLDGHTSFQNAGKTIKKGFELTGDYAVMPGLRLGGSYAYSDYRYDEFTELVGGRPVDRSGNRMPYVPRDQYSLFADYRHPSGFKARIQANTWGSYYMDNANSEEYEGYELVTDLMLGYSSGPHSLSLNVDNLFDQRYAIEVKKDTRGTEYYAAGSPRTFMANYSYAF